MRAVWILGLAVPLAGMPAMCRPDDDRSRPPQVYSSSSGLYQFRVVEPDNYEPGFGVRARGTLYRRSTVGLRTMLWSKLLINVPDRALVSEDGRAVVTIDTYGFAGAAHALVLYGRTGHILGDFSLDELLTPDEIDRRVPYTSTSRLWATKARFAFGRDQKQLVIRMEWGRTIKLDERTGKLALNRE